MIASQNIYKNNLKYWNKNGAKTVQITISETINIVYKCDYWKNKIGKYSKGLD